MLSWVGERFGKSGGSKAGENSVNNLSLILSVIPRLKN